MITDVPWWTKLWWKGVDMSATVISSGLSALVIAIVATLTLKRKRKRDLEFESQKQLQAIRIASEHARIQKIDARLINVRRWQTEREALARRAETTLHSRNGFEIVSDYVRWLRATELVNFKGNWTVIGRWDEFPSPS